MLCCACTLFLSVGSHSIVDEIDLIKQIPEDITAVDIAKDLKVRLIII